MILVAFSNLSDFMILCFTLQAQWNRDMHEKKKKEKQPKTKPKQKNKERRDPPFL